MVQLTPSERSSNQIFFGFVGKFLWNSETFMHPSHPPNHNPPSQDHHQLIGWWPTTFGNFDFFEPMMPLTPSCWPKARIIETATSKKLFAFSDTKRRYESLHEGTNANWPPKNIQKCKRVALLKPIRRLRFASADSMSSPKPRRLQNLATILRVSLKDIVGHNIEFIGASGCCDRNSENYTFKKKATSQYSATCMMFLEVG